MPSVLVPWHGQAKHAAALAWAGQARILALAVQHCLGVGRPSMRWCLGMGSPSVLVPWHGQAKHVGALAWAGRVRILALAVQRWPSEKEKKKFARNFLKFCVVVYSIILSIAGKNRFKILENEAFRGGGDN